MSTQKITSKSGGAKSARRSSRAVSIDSVRSLDSLSSRAEDELLRSDEETLQQITIDQSELTAQLEPKANGNKPDSGKIKKKQEPKQQNDNNDPVMKLLLDIQKKQFTKQDSKALKNSLDGKFAAIETELGSTNGRVDCIETRMRNLETKVESAQYERELQKQQLLKNNLSIFGCPKLENENIRATAVKILNAFGCDFNNNDFAAVYRLDGKSPKFSTIIVKMHDFGKKLMALNSKAKKPVKLNDIAATTSSQVNSQIYINNHVTPFFGRLLAAGRQATKDEIIHSCWIGASGCLIKMKEDSKPLNIRSMDEIAAIRSSAKPNNKRAKPDDSSPQNQNIKKSK